MVEFRKSFLNAMAQAFPLLNNLKSFAILSLQVSCDMESIIARPPKLWWKFVDLCLSSVNWENILGDLISQNKRDDVHKISARNFTVPRLAISAFRFR